MKQVMFELPLAQLDRLGFPPSLTKHHVELVRLLRCDDEEYAFVCRVGQEGLPSFKQVLEAERDITHVERLSRERDGSETLLVKGRCHWRQIGSGRCARVCLLGLPTISGQSVRLTLAGEESQIRRLLQNMVQLRISHRVLCLSRLKPVAGSPLDGLTMQQRRILRLAHAVGYYDLPRRVSTEELARRLGMDKGTVGEHLRRAEKRLMDQVLA